MSVVTLVTMVVVTAILMSCTGLCTARAGHYSFITSIKETVMTDASLEGCSEAGPGVGRSVNEHEVSGTVPDLLGVCTVSSCEMVEPTKSVPISIEEAEPYGIHANLHGHAFAFVAA